MKRKILLTVGILMIALLCCACGDSQNTKNFSTIAEEFTTALYSEDYDTCLKSIDELYREDMGEDALRDIVSGTTVQFGKFQSVGTGQSVETDDYLEMMGLTQSSDTADLEVSVYYQPVTMAGGELGLFYIFSPSTRMICGISVCTETAMNAELNPGYENDDNEYDEEDIDEPEAED